MEEKTCLYRRWGDLLFALLALVIILTVLFWGSSVGLSNNGDFGRVMNASSLMRTETRASFVFVDEFEIQVVESSLFSNVARVLFSTEGLRDYPSIHVLLVRLSVAANLALNHLTGVSLSLYRLGVLGAMTALLYVGLIFALFRQLKWKNIWAEIAVKAALLVMLCDIGYIAYFNSFYSESVQILGFLMILIFGIRLLKGQGSLGDFIGLTLAAVLFGWSKLINLPMGILLILAFGAIFLLRHYGARFAVLKTCGVGFLGILVLLGVYFSIPKWMDFDTNYNSVFYSIVKDVEEEEAIRRLEALGLSGEMAVFSSTNIYVRGVRASFREAGFEEEFREIISKFGLLRFYLGHPGLLWENIEMSLAHSGQIRPWYMSNYPAEYGRFVLSNQFATWTNLRSALAFDTAYGNLMLWAGLFALFGTAPLTNLEGRKRLWAKLLALGAFFGAGVYALVIQMIANGEGDLAKHLFVYVQFVDLIVGLLVAGLLYSVACLVETKRIEPMLRAFPLALALLVLLTPLLNSAVRTPRHVVPLEDAQVGDLVQLGSYGGQELRWLVVAVGEESKTLFAMDNVSYLAFDSGNRNDWTHSELRVWLNTVFLYEAFADTSDIMPFHRPIFLSAVNDYRREAGDRELYTFHIPRYAARGLERAYREYVIDRVQLPDIAMAAHLLVWGGNIGGGFWLETPFYANGEMMRYVSRDRYILMRDALELAGVRPVIEVSRGR